jgi:hypothetical protein
MTNLTNPIKNPKRSSQRYFMKIHFESISGPHKSFDWEIENHVSISESESNFMDPQFDQKA